LKSALYILFPSISDSLQYAGKFLQKQPVALHPVELESVQDHGVIYLLFGLLTLLAFIRFFYPATLETLFSSFGGTGVRRDAENYNKPGWVVPLFLTINFLISTTLLLKVFFIKTGLLSARAFESPSLWGIIAGGVIFYYLFYQLITFLAGFLFNTMKQAVLQIKNNARWVFVSGILLTPMLLIYFYFNSILMTDIMILTVVILWVIKWIQTVRIGWTARNFNLLHLFLYLCAVEIMPLLLLIKWGIQ
jgi:hypothetical protein